MFTFLMISDVEQLFVYPLPICRSSLENMSIWVFAHFLIGLFAFCLFVFVVVFVHLFAIEW